tara:strand:- start:422 stop:1312 length:891 start_codon:yes stop_codon:yes gene_type:complete
MLNKPAGEYYKPHPNENQYREYSGFIKKNLNFYNNNNWMTLQRWVDWEGGHTWPYDINTFDFAFVHIPNNEMWQFWINNVPDYNKSKFVELHLNKDPLYNDLTQTMTYNHNETLPNDLLTNKAYSKRRFDWLTLLRDPVERVISEYYFIGKTMPLESHQKPLHTVTRFWGHLPIGAVETLDGYNNVPQTHNTQVRWLIGKGFLGNYTVTENDCDMLIDRMEELDFKVGIQDKMGDSLNYFNDTLNLNLDINNVPHKRDMSSHKPYVSDDIRDKIKENNKWDIKLYNYFSEKLDSVI